MDAIKYTDKGWEATKPLSQMTKEEKRVAMNMVARDFAVASGIGAKKPTPK